MLVRLLTLNELESRSVYGSGAEWSLGCILFHSIGAEVETAAAQRSCCEPLHRCRTCSGE